MENDGLEEKTVLCLTSSREPAHNDCSTVITRLDCEVHTKENHANGWNEGNGGPSLVRNLVCINYRLEQQQTERVSSPLSKFVCYLMEQTD